MNGARRKGSRSPSSRGLLVAAALVTFVHAGPAWANDPATAQALFDQARTLMDKEEWSLACPKLEESQRLDPGGGTLLHLALCREHEGRIATAWAHYRDALAAAKRDNRKDRARVAQARIDALGPRLPRLRVRVAPQNRQLSGFRISRENTSVGEAQWGESFPIDPGTRTISAQADGYKTWSSKIEVPASPGETVVDVPALEPDPQARAAPPPADARRSVKPPPRSTSREEATRGDGQRTVGLAAGGVGIAGLAAGSIFGLMAISKNSEADKECRPPALVRCSQAGVDAGREAQTFGDASTIAFIAGTVFLGLGAVLYVTAPDAKVGLSPALSPGGAGLSLTGKLW